MSRRVTTVEIGPINGIIRLIIEADCVELSDLTRDGETDWFITKIVPSTGFIRVYGSHPYEVTSVSVLKEKVP